MGEREEAVMSRCLSDFLKEQGILRPNHWPQESRSYSRSYLEFERSLTLASTAFVAGWTAREAKESKEVDRES